MEGEDGKWPSFSQIGGDPVLRAVWRVCGAVQCNAVQCSAVQSGTPVAIRVPCSPVYRRGRPRAVVGMRTLAFRSLDGPLILGIRDDITGIGATWEPLHRWGGNR
jgi:hypothetical protein